MLAYNHIIIIFLNFLQPELETETYVKLKMTEFLAIQEVIKKWTSGHVS